MKFFFFKRCTCRPIFTDLTDRRFQTLSLRLLFSVCSTAPVSSFYQGVRNVTLTNESFIAFGDETTHVVPQSYKDKSLHSSSGSAPCCLQSADHSPQLQSRSRHHCCLRIRPGCQTQFHTGPKFKTGTKSWAKLTRSVM